MPAEGRPWPSDNDDDDDDDDDDDEDDDDDDEEEEDHDYHDGVIKCLLLRLLHRMMRLS